MSVQVCVGGLFDDDFMRRLPKSLRRLLANEPDEVKRDVAKAYMEHPDRKGWHGEWDAPFGSGKKQ